MRWMQVSTSSTGDTSRRRTLAASSAAEKLAVRVISATMAIGPPDAWKSSKALRVRPLLECWEGGEGGEGGGTLRPRKVAGCWVRSVAVVSHSDAAHGRRGKPPGGRMREKHVSAVAEAIRVAHPLEPLTAAEIGRASEIVRTERSLSPERVRFVTQTALC